MEGQVVHLSGKPMSQFRNFVRGASPSDRNCGRDWFEWEFQTSGRVNQTRGGQPSSSQQSASMRLLDRPPPKVKSPDDVTFSRRSHEAPVNMFSSRFLT